MDGQALLRLLKPPALWQRSEPAFWADEHISKGMLAAHLDPERQAASRRHDEIERSARWLAGQLPAGGAVLDLGCGPGLYTRRLSALGFEMTGMDLSPRSIAYAAGQDSRSRYLCADYLQMDIEAGFDAALIIYCDYAALIPGERQALLRRAHRALRPGGLLILDVFTPRHAERRREARDWQLHAQGGFWDAGPHLCLHARHAFEQGLVWADQYVIVSEQGSRDYLIWDSAYTVDKMRAEALPQGFAIEAVYGDACGRTPEAAPDTLCFVLRRGMS